MEDSEIRALLESVRDSSLGVEEALLRLRDAPFEDLGYAKIDVARERRTGAAEVVYGAGKSPEQIARIMELLAARSTGNVMVTRLDGAAAEAVNRITPIEYFEVARIGVVRSPRQRPAAGKVIVATGGTSDIPVAEEAAVTAELLASRVQRIYDVGVAGIHRVLAHADDFASANAVVCVAGMEGALASVVGGLCECPVIAVPTSVGYGAAFSGLAALLGMLNSCASGVSVVNIDNGFGAGHLASRINLQAAAI
jgi:NCAIR mutase (PurE)-related protein